MASEMTPEDNVPSFYRVPGSKPIHVTIRSLNGGQLSAKITDVSMTSFFVTASQQQCRDFTVHVNDILENCQVAFGTKRLSIGPVQLRYFAEDDYGDFLFEFRALDSGKYPATDLIGHSCDVDDDDLTGIPQIKPWGSRNSRQERVAARMEVRIEDGLISLLYIKQRGEKFLVPCQVYDISATGISVVVQEVVWNDFDSIDRAIGVYLKFPSGEEYELTYEIRSKVLNHGGGIRLGMKFVEGSDALSKVKNIDPYLTLSSNNQIAGVIYKKNLYQERCAIRILGISKKSALISVYENDLILLPAMKVEIEFFVEAGGIQRILGRVHEVKLSTQNRMNFTMNIEEFPEKAEYHIINHIVLNEDYSLEQLRQCGFKVREVADNFKFRYVKNQEEYIEVLKLRLEAYRGAGKVAEAARPKDMVCRNDLQSRIVVAIHQGKIVASATIYFPNGLTDKFELDDFISLSNFIPLEERTNYLEVSRLCIRSDYRRGDLLMRMFGHLYKVMVSSGRARIITSCDEKLWTIYRRIGFKKTGLEYAHQKLNGLKHYVISVHQNTGIFSSGVNLLVWDHIYRRMTDYMVSRGAVKLTRLDRALIRVNRGVSLLILRFAKTFGVGPKS